jgi:hypothetical protein
MWYTPFLGALCFTAFVNASPLSDSRSLSLDKNVSLPNAPSTRPFVWSSLGDSWAVGTMMYSHAARTRY